MSVPELAAWAGLDFPAQRHTVDWEQVSRELGTALPRDYCDLVANFGGGSFDTHIWIHAPRSDEGPYDLLAGVLERDQARSILWRAGEERPPWFAEEDRLIAWASTGDGEYIHWWVRQGAAPDEWPIAIQDYDGDWELHEMSATDFLNAWVRQELSSELLSSHFSVFEHSFTQFDQTALR